MSKRKDNPLLVVSAAKRARDVMMLHHHPSWMRLRGKLRQASLESHHHKSELGTSDYVRDLAAGVFDRINRILVDEFDKEQWNYYFFSDESMYVGTALRVFKLMGLVEAVSVAYHLQAALHIAIVHMTKSRKDEYVQLLQDLAFGAREADVAGIVADYVEVPTVELLDRAFDILVNKRRQSANLYDEFPCCMPTDAEQYLYDELPLNNLPR